MGRALPHILTHFRHRNSMLALASWARGAAPEDIPQNQRFCSSSSLKPTPPPSFQRLEAVGKARTTTTSMLAVGAENGNPYDPVVSPDGSQVELKKLHDHKVMQQAPGGTTGYGVKDDHIDGLLHAMSNKLLSGDFET